MRPLDLEEFAADLYRNGNEFGKEILDLIDIENDIAIPYAELCAELEYATESANIPVNEEINQRRVEWLCDRSHLLNELTDMLDKAGYQGDVDDALRQIISDLDEVRVQLEDTQEELEGLKNSPMDYDL